MRYFNNFDAFMKLVLSMKDGFGNTLMIFFFTLLFSLPLELAVALLRRSRRKIISVPTSLYILVMRGTPLMLQIFAIYFAIPTLTGVNLDRMNAHHSRLFYQLCRLLRRDFPRRHSIHPRRPA